MQHLSFHPIIVPDSFDRRIERLSGLQINAYDVALGLLVLQIPCVIYLIRTTCER